MIKVKVLVYPYDPSANAHVIFDYLMEKMAYKLRSATKPARWRSIALWMAVDWPNSRAPEAPA